MASSTSCDHKKRYHYDVFLSFSGEETRRSFVDHLNEALQRHGIRTFKDDERLQKGKEIKNELLKSIEDSKFCVIVFSKKYASSSWCLDELVKIMECHKTTDQTAFPVFYDVEPTEVRKQSGSVGEAFAKHTKRVVVRTTLTRNVIGKALARHSNKRLGKWRKALKDAANLCGWELKNTAHGHEAQVIKLIVERISLELRSINVGIDENLVGMEERMLNFDHYLEIGTDDVRMIGIKGMGGAGKTTLAQAIFDRISFNFEGKSFVGNVRENSKAGLEKLQEQVIRDILKDTCIRVSSVHEGKKLLKTMLCGKRVLVVLDDVDHKDQLEALAGYPNWFKLGSIIIIATRDEQVLTAHGVKWIHDVNLLTDEEAIRLFHMHAFRQDIPNKEYAMQSLEVVRYAAGLPLTLKVLGSFLCGKDESEWIDALARLKKIPLKETVEKLELSYESLEDDYKKIFLDVACFSSYRWKDKAIRMLESCGFHARSGLRVLQQKSLITIDKENRIHMHDHIEEMGKNIVRRENHDEPHRRSRLWVQEEIEHVLANDLGTEAIRCLELKITPGIALESLQNMKKLRCLIVKDLRFGNFSQESVITDEARQYFPNSLQYLCWNKYPHWCLPKTFEANILVTLEMYGSKIKQLWKGGKVMKKLKFLNLSSSNLRSLDLGLTPNLQRLELINCTDLVNIYVYGGCLKSLVYLNLRGCKSLKSRVFIKQLESVETLHISGLDMREFSDFIITGHSNNSVLDLQLRASPIEEVPSSIANLHKLVSLELYYCKKLKSLPRSVCCLQHLRSLSVRHSSIEELPEDISQLESLEMLDLLGTNFKHLPRSICMLKRLKTLILGFCDLVEKLHEDIGQLESLEKLDLKYCYNLKDIPNSICKLKRLKELNLKGCNRLEKLPDDLGHLECLRLLNIEDTGITHLPQSISLLKGLKTCGSEQIPDDDFIRLCSEYDSEKGQIQGFQHLRILDLGRCGIEELPEALGHLERLEELNLSYTDVKHLPDSICMLKQLKKLVLRRCVLLEKLPDNVDQLESLEVLHLSMCYSIREIPNNICVLKQLKILDLRHCFCLEKLPEDVGQLESLEKLYLSRCYNITEIPSSIRMLKHLEVLGINGCRRLEVPSDELGNYISRILPGELGKLDSLQDLDIRATSITNLPFLWSSSLLRKKRKVNFHEELDIPGTGITLLSCSSSLFRNKIKVIFHGELDIRATGIILLPGNSSNFQRTKNHLIDQVELYDDDLIHALCKIFD